MPARTLSTLKLTGTTVASLAAAASMLAPAGGQTLYADVNAQRAKAMAVCDGIRDPNERVGCRGQKSIEFDNARAAAAQTAD